MNGSYNAENEECRAHEDDFFNLFRRSVFSNCMNATREAERRVNVKEEECERLRIPPCSGRGYCNGSSCVCEGTALTPPLTLDSFP